MSFFNRIFPKFTPTEKEKLELKRQEDNIRNLKINNEKIRLEEEKYAQQVAEQLTWIEKLKRALKYFPKEWESIQQQIELRIISTFKLVMWLTDKERK